MSFTLSFIQDKDLFTSLLNALESSVFKGIVSAALAEFADHASDHMHDILKFLHLMQVGDRNIRVGFPRATTILQAITFTQPSIKSDEDKLLPLMQRAAERCMRWQQLSHGIQVWNWSRTARGMHLATTPLFGLFHSLRIAAGARIRQIIMGARELTASAAAAARPSKLAGRNLESHL